MPPLAAFYRGPDQRPQSLRCLFARARSTPPACVSALHGTMARRSVGNRRPELTAIGVTIHGRPLARQTKPGRGSLVACNPKMLRRRLRALTVLLAAGSLVAIAPRASAQPTQPASAEEQSSAASIMADQLAAAAQEYFTNGAQATAVPTSGPAAAYFTNGAEATAVPTFGPWADYYRNGASVMAASTNAIPEPAFDMSLTGATSAVSTARQNATSAANAKSATSASSAISAPIAAASAQTPTQARPASFPATSSIVTSSADQASGATAPNASADGVGEAMPDDSRSETIAEAIESTWLVANEGAASVATMATAGLPAVANASPNGSSNAHANQTSVEQAHAEQGGSATVPPTARVRSRGAGWVPILLGGIGIGALLVILGARMRPSTRAPTRTGSHAGPCPSRSAELGDPAIIVVKATERREGDHVPAERLGW